jgi:hypothetical protein
MMKLIGAIICVFRGHKISKTCQTSLKESKTKKFETLCERCSYPLTLEIDTNDVNSFYVIEEDSVQKIFPDKKTVN